MKKFFINVTLFLLPLVAVFLLLEKGLQQVPNSYNQKKKLLQERMAEVEVINLGSSNAVNGINPEYFSRKSFNLANVTQTIYYDEELLKYYIDKLPKLKVVIIPITYVTLHRRIQDMEEQWRKYFYYYYWNIQIENEATFDINKYSLFTIYNPHVVMGIIRRGFKVNMAPKITPLGFDGRDTVGHLRHINDADGKTRVNYHSEGYNAVNVKEGTAHLEEIIKMLKAKNIEAVLVTTPVYKTYSSNARPEVIAAMKQVTDEMQSKYGCKYFNYFTDARFSIDDFADNDHLNYLGAAKFSKILDSEVIQPVFQGK